MNYEIITVATHNYGTFNQLINNKYNSKIKVLGWKQKWTSFKMKFQLMYQYIKNMDNNKIIIFLDGFDTIIHNNPNNALKIFKNNNYKLVFSKNINNHFYGIEKFVYNTCKNDLIINTGMYMGYVKYLKILLKEAIQEKCKDDQRIFNNYCNKYNFIDIDVKEQIFKNIDIKKKYYLKNEKAIFISFPGNITFNRIYRSLFEYMQFFFINFLIISLLICLVLFFCGFYNLLFLFILIIIIYLFKIDYSCL